NDPFLVEECFVRPVLVDRLARSFYSANRPIASTATEEASPVGVTWDDWWARVEDELDEARVETVSDSSAPLAAPASTSSPGEPCVPVDSWDNGKMDDIPDRRDDYTMVWTGSEAIIWGGQTPRYLNTGFRYDPLLDR